MDIDIYKSLKEEANPIYIYGAGSLANQIYRKMLRYDIDIAGIATDSGEELFDNKKVIKFSELIEGAEENSIAIIEGFASAYARRDELLKESAIANVYEIAIPYDHHAHFDDKWVEKNQNKLEDARELLADDYSKDVFDALIKAISNESADYVRSVFKKEMSFFVNDVFKVVDEEVFLDIGAYKGGSIASFLKATDNKYKKIIGIEPEQENYRVLKEYCDGRGIKADLYNIGCWYKKDTLCFEADDKISRLSNDGKIKIEVDRVDNIVGVDDKISLINLGISVSEKEIILGAEELIKKYKPRWVIYMGGAREELYSIPILIKELMPSYELYLRFIQAMPSRIFLFVK